MTGAAVTLALKVAADAIGRQPGPAAAAVGAPRPAAAAGAAEQQLALADAALCSAVAEVPPVLLRLRNCTASELVNGQCSNWALEQLELRLDGKETVFHRLQAEVAAVLEQPAVVDLVAARVGPLPAAAGAEQQQLEAARALGALRCANVACANVSGVSEGSLRRHTCGGCRAVRYCSQACNKAAWAAHKRACRLLQAGSGTAAPPAAGSLAE